MHELFTDLSVIMFDLSLQADGKLKPSGSMSKLRASIVRSGVRFVQKLTSPHGVSNAEQSLVGR